MTLTTEFTKLVGCKHPIMVGGMHFVGYAELAAAVSNAGGLGTITALTQKSAADLRQEIRKCKSLLKSETLPIAVNLTLLPVLLPPDYQSYADVIVEEKIKVVETAGRNPAKFIHFFKQHDIVVIHKCTSIRHALTAEREGVDCISMDGFEAGGHPGEDDVTNWVLLPKSARTLRIPFIASGSCVTGRQLAAALCLGAGGMNCGTRFIASREARVHNDIKNAICNASEIDTDLILRPLRNTERVFKNRTSDKIKSIEDSFLKESNGADRDDGELLGRLIPYIKGENYRKSFQETGDAASSVWSCGQGIGLIDNVSSCSHIISSIVQEAEFSLRDNFSKLSMSKL